MLPTSNNFTQKQQRSAGVDAGGRFETRKTNRGVLGVEPTTPDARVQKNQMGRPGEQPMVSVGRFVRNTEKRIADSLR